MNDRNLFIALIGASVVGALLLAPALASAVGDYLTIAQAKVTVDDNLMTARFTTQHTIPLEGAFGYGVFTKVTEGEGGPLPAEAIVTTTHAGVLDSEKQADKDDSIMHNHYVKLVAADGSVCPSTIQVGEITWESPGGVVVAKNRATMQDAPLDFDGTFSLNRSVELSYSGGTPLVGASFTLGPVFDGGGNLTNVCVNPVDFPHKLTPAN